MSTKWSDVKGYKRDYLRDKFAGKTTQEADVLKAGQVMGLKEVTIKMKLRRWAKEGRLSKAASGGGLVFK